MPGSVRLGVAGRAGETGSLCKRTECALAALERSDTEVRAGPPAQQGERSWSAEWRGGLSAELLAWDAWVMGVAGDVEPIARLVRRV